MSKLSDYSKFDHLDDSSEEENEGAPATLDESEAISPAIHEQQQQQQQQQEEEPIATTRKDPKTGRYVFEYGGTTIYEWEQSLEEVNIYVKAPPGVKAAQIVCNISPRKLELGIRGSDRYFISEATYSLVDTSESSWYMDDDIINIVLIKAHRAETWESALKTVAARVDAFQKQDIQKSLLLERFQQENPGFDFRDAEFNGSVPDPRTFMGGVNYK